jgi:hypothetical protein
MFNATFHLTSGDAVRAELDDREIEQLVADLLALPDVVPGLLERRPSEDDLAEREAQLQLVAVALGESLRREGTLNFLAEHARSVVVDTAAIAAIEVTDPEAPPSRGDRVRITSRQNLATPVV